MFPLSKFLDYWADWIILAWFPLLLHCNVKSSSILTSVHIDVPITAQQPLRVEVPGPAEVDLDLASEGFSEAACDEVQPGLEGEAEHAEDDEAS